MTGTYITFEEVPACPARRSGVLTAVATALLSWTLATLTPALAQSDAATVTAVIREQAGIEAMARQSQNQIAELDEAVDRLLGEYRQKTAEADSLRAYNRQMEAQVASQQKEMASIEQQFNEIETTAREVLPLMQRMIATLEQFVSLDLPFLVDERGTRVASLKEMMERADVSVSEKYRRILEAYGIEMEYGRTIESYRDELALASGTATVDILRLGRVALLYQSLDGESTGYWDAARQQWVPDNAYQRSVRQGLRIARQQTAPGLIVVPVAAPKEN